MARTPEDDWFPRVGTSASPDKPGGPIEDEWLVGDDPLPATRFDPWSLANRRVLIPTGLAFVFLVALLAAVGVFSSGSPAIPATAATVGSATTSVTRATTPPAARSTPTPPTTTLKPGDSGSQVKALQRELASLGYYVGAIDGQYGPATIKAVTAFQRQSANRLTPDGIVGPSTLLALAP